MSKQGEHNASSGLKHLNIVVTGKVQGVFFRQSTLEKGREQGIKGTVKNLEDNHTVEIIATGDDKQLAAFIEWCKQGPPKAEVLGLEIEELALQEFNKFSIL